MGLRLRLNNSEDSEFDKAVETYSKAFAISGHNCQKVKTALMLSKKIDRIRYLKKEPQRNNYRRRNKSIKN